MYPVRMRLRSLIEGTRKRGRQSRCLCCMRDGRGWSYGRGRVVELGDELFIIRIVNL
jgi:hypothetical protein